MKKLIRSGALAAAFSLLSRSAYAADVATIEATNWNAIFIFLAFVIVTLGFIAAFAFATNLAVVSGLTLSRASAVSHDL